MLECLFGCDAFTWVVDEDAAEEIEELLVEFGVWGDCVLWSDVVSCCLDGERDGMGKCTSSRFMARTYFLEALGVS